MLNLLTFRRTFLAFLAAFLVAGAVWIVFVQIAGRMVFDESEITTSEVTTVPPPRR
jgi:TRAP-type C4-dicarboxylate transport system permease small subunit